jgi:betaine-aldehyde dehydrogenase
MPRPPVAGAWAWQSGRPSRLETGYLRYQSQPARITRRLEAGLIYINGWGIPAVEFEEGGFKSSGLGRLGGRASLDDFLEYKQILQSYA